MERPPLQWQAACCQYVTTTGAKNQAEGYTWEEKYILL
nr:MAG TPA: hypothetical protein [Caudoviricetes sp.]